MSFSGSGWSGSSSMALGGTTGDKLVSFQTEIWVHMTWASSCPPQSSPAASHTAKWECPFCRGSAHVHATSTQNKTAPSHHGQHGIYNCLMNVCSPDWDIRVILSDDLWEILKTVWVQKEGSSLFCRILYVTGLNQFRPVPADSCDHQNFSCCPASWPHRMKRHHVHLRGRSHQLCSLHLCTVCHLSLGYVCVCMCGVWGGGLGYASKLLHPPSPSLFDCMGMREGFNYAFFYTND